MILDSTKLPVTLQKVKEEWGLEENAVTQIICDDFHELVPFVQFKKRKNI